MMKIKMENSDFSSYSISVTILLSGSGFRQLEFLFATDESSSAGCKLRYFYSLKCLYALQQPADMSQVGVAPFNLI
jgi:hypothetical protein